MNWSEIISWLVLGSTLFLFIGFTFAKNMSQKMMREHEKHEEEMREEELAEQHEEEKDKYTPTPWI